MSIPHRNPKVFWQRCLVSSAIAVAVATSVLAGLLSNRPVLAQETASVDDWLQTAVSYILTDGDRAEFGALTTTADRERFIAEFWRRHNPTPGTSENEFKDEHDRRVAYANALWASASGAGWKSDQGRIYIIYGPPDEIEDHPLKFQRWRYREGTFANVILEFSQMGYPLDSGNPNILWLGSRGLSVPVGDDRSIRRWVHGDCLLHKAVEEFSPAA